MSRYTYRDYDIADRFVRDCFNHFQTNNISKIRSFVEFSYNRNNLSFNEYFACLDILNDKERGIWYE